MKYTTLRVNGREIGKIGIANTFFLRFRGLLGRELNDFDGIVITPCNNIHMMFMKYPIDVLFVDKNRKIIKIDDTLKPWTFCSCDFKAKDVVELRAGTVRKHSISTGDTVEY